jgi:NitT/TauT family transport system permease protein
MSDTALSAAHTPNTASVRRLPNGFDLAALLFIAALLIAVAHAARHTFAPLDVPRGLGKASIQLDPAYLPGYALRTVMRMFAALACSLLFTFTYATFAAKSRRASMVLVPILDILQSLPIFGFLTFTVTFFLGLFPGQVIGAELAVIFVIFTSQAWNMAFSMYQSLRTIPSDLDEASRGFRLSPWQRFWRLEVPFATPGLVWNMMMSMSGGWFMPGASEAVTVGDTSFQLPGIGSYIAVPSVRATSTPCCTPSSRCCWLSSPTTSCCSGRWSPGAANSGSRRRRWTRAATRGCSPCCAAPAFLRFLATPWHRLLRR